MRFSLDSLPGRSWAAEELSPLWNGWATPVDYVREGDVLVVWRLDRLGRSLPHLLQVVESLADRGVGFRSITEAMDTTTSGGRLIFSIFGALAEFERAILRERTRAGLGAARARGRQGGRPSVMSPTKARSARALLASGTSPSGVASSLGVGRSTLYRWVERERAARPKSLTSRPSVVPT